MPSNLSLFLPLVAGFVFLSWFILTRYISLTWDGPRLIFWAGFCGSFLFLLSRLFMVFLQGWRLDITRLADNPIANELTRAIQVLLPAHGDFAGSLVGTLLLGIVFPLILNLAYEVVVPGNREAEFAIWRARRSLDDELLLMLVNEVGTGRPIALTMADDKVYVGFVLSHPGLQRVKRTEDRRFFAILPTLSGYRDKDTRALRITTNYAPLLKAITGGSDPIIRDYSLEDLRLLLPLSEVRSARIFDQEIYTRLFGEELPDPRRRSKPRRRTSR